MKSFQKHFDHETVTVGDMQMKFSDFLAYSKSNHDEMPLYLFDKHFAKKVPKLAQDYQVNSSNHLVPHALLLGDL